MSEIAYELHYTEEDTEHEYAAILTPATLSKVGGKGAEESDPFESFDGPKIDAGKRAQ